MRYDKRLGEATELTTLDTPGLGAGERVGAVRTEQVGAPGPAAQPSRATTYVWACRR